MTVQYEVSPDEYAEACRGDIPNRDWASAAAMFMVALALAMIGIGIFSAGDEQAIVPALLLGLGAVVLIATAVWAVTFGTVVLKLQFSRKIKSGYREHYQGKSLVFSFDGNGWSTKPLPDQESVAWPSLTAATDYENVLLLHAENHAVLLPKRVLSPESLRALKRFAFGEFRSPVKLRVGFRDFLITEIRSLWRRKRSAMSILHWGGIVIAATITVWATEKPGALGYILALSLLSVTVSAQFCYFAVSYFTQRKRRHAVWELECSDRGAHARTATSEHFSSWSMFLKYEETPSAFLLYSGPDRYYILPRQGLVPEQQEGLRRALQLKLQVQ